MNANSMQGSFMQVSFKNWNCQLVARRYSNGRIALVLHDEEGVVATASTNMADEDLAPDEVCIKDWTENEGMVAALVQAGAILPPHRMVPSHFVSVPVCRLSPAALATLRSQ